jgi:hypothetical protein
MLKDYKVLEGENIHNLAIKLYGDVSYSLKLLNDNNLDYSDSLSGRLIVYDSSIKETVLEPLIIAPIKSKNMLQDYVSINGQSIFDVCLNLTGSLENVVNVFVNSNMTSLNNALNREFVFSYVKSSDPFVLYAERRNLIFKTGLNLQQNKLGEFDNSFDQKAFS